MKIKRGYEQRVREIEHGSFTPLVFSLTGGIGKATTVFLQETRFADCCKRAHSYSSTLSWLRCSLSFALLKCAIQCIRGARSSIGAAGRQMLPPMELVARRRTSPPELLTHLSQYCDDNFTSACIQYRYFFIIITIV